VNKALRSRIKELSTRAAEQEITLRNEMGVWVNSPGQDPKQLLTSNFRQGAEAMEAEVGAFAEDFSVDNINQWVSDRTNGKIPKLLEPGTLGPDDSALLANVFYLLANWTEQFDADLTKPKPFKTPDNVQGTDVQMMQKGGLSYEEQAEMREQLMEKGLSGSELYTKMEAMTANPEVRYSETADYQAASLDFGKKDDNNPGGTKFSLNLVVPKQVDGLKSVYNSLTQEGQNGESKLQNLMDTLASAWPTELKTLQLPKFKMTEEIDWMPVMEQMGMPLDKLNITQEQFKEFVSQMKGKSFVDVNEKGAEMAFADFAKVTLECVQMPPSKQLIADRPFMWVFTAQKDGKAQVLAQGTIVTPPKYEG
jgi:serine protease inhibitor